MAVITAYIAVCLFASAMIQAAFSDLTTMTIRNQLVLLLLGAYVILAPLVGFSPNEIFWSTMAALAVLIIAFGLFTQGWFGGGDAKLASVTVLWLGAHYTLSYVIYTALLGGALTVGLLYFRSCRLPVTLADRGWVSRLHDRQSGVPYGIALAGSALLIFPSTRWVTSLL